MIVGWNIRTEKLLCFMVLDDGIARHVVPDAADAYWRAFIVQNRETEIVTARFRFRKLAGDEWFEVTPEEQNDQMVEYLRSGLESTIRIALALSSGIASEAAIECFYPPDDGGDGAKTVIWLEMQDLITMKNFEKKH